MSGDQGLQPIDLLLGEGSPAAQAAARQRIAEEPLAALELAETVELVERLREARTATSPLFAPRLQLVIATARRRQLLRRPRRHHRDIAWLALAAAVALVCLTLWDPAGRSARSRSLAAGAAELPAARHGVRDAAGLPVRLLPDPGDVAAAVAFVANRLKAEGDARMLAALEHIVVQPAAEANWLQSGNQLAAMRADSDRRRSAELRRAALHELGSAEGVDDRIQDLAATIANGVMADLARGRLDVVSAAFVARALIASGAAGDGGPCASSLSATVTWLREQLTDNALGDGERATAVAALAEVAASTGKGLELVREQTERLLRNTLEVPAFSRRRPTLLLPHTPALHLGDAGRLLRLAPAFGIDADEACRLRVLLAARLEANRALNSDDPALLAAEVYGFADLLDCESIDRKLRGWRTSDLVPDYLTILQVAWSRRVHSPGFSRLQMELRALVAATPQELRDRAALLLCLATNFAAPGISALQRVAASAEGEITATPRGY
jgi:hypothetical protein